MVVGLPFTVRRTRCQFPVLLRCLALPLWDTHHPTLTQPRYGRKQICNLRSSQLFVLPCKVTLLLLSLQVVERMLNISSDYWKQYMLTSDNPHQLSPGSPVGSYTSSPPKSPATPEFKPGIVYNGVVNKCNCWMISSS